MSHGPQRFTLSEIKRLIRAAKAEGLNTVSFKLGKVEVQIGAPAPAQAAPANDLNEWDTVLANMT